MPSVPTRAAEMVQSAVLAQFGRRIAVPRRSRTTRARAKPARRSATRSERSISDSDWSGRWASMAARALLAQLVDPSVQAAARGCRGCRSPRRPARRRRCRRAAAMTMSSIASARPTVPAPCTRLRRALQDGQQIPAALRARHSSGCVVDPGKAAGQELGVADLVAGHVMLADQVGLELGDTVVGAAVEAAEAAHDRVDGGA